MQISANGWNPLLSLTQSSFLPLIYREPSMVLHYRCSARLDGSCGGLVGARLESLRPQFHEEDLGNPLGAELLIKRGSQAVQDVDGPNELLCARLYGDSCNRLH